MHQDHNIPWNTLAAHFKFVKDNPRYEPRKTNLCPLSQPTQTKDINYFVTALTRTIEEFSATERNKYPKSFPTPTKGKLFSDELLEKDRSAALPGPRGLLSERSQMIENWIGGTNFQHTGADAVKALIYDGQMETLLMLANHPDIDLAKYYNCMGNPLWYSEWGWKAVSSFALLAYIFFNVVAAKPELCTGATPPYGQMASFARVVDEIAGFSDDDEVKWFHRRFFGAAQFWEKMKNEYSSTLVEQLAAVNVFDDLDALHEYLKKCFVLLYRCDMLAREVGVQLCWRDEIARVLDIWWPTKSSIQQVNGEYDWAILTWSERKKRSQWLYSFEKCAPCHRYKPATDGRTTVS